MLHFERRLRQAALVSFVKQGVCWLKALSTQYVWLSVAQGANRQS